MATPETLKAAPVHPEDATLEATILRKSQPFKAGGVDSKRLLTCKFPGGSVGTFVQRPYCAYFASNYVGMRDAGLPVVSTLHHDAHRNWLIMPDLKADGSELYGKSLFWAAHIQKRRHRPSAPADAQFQQLMEIEHHKGFAHGPIANRAGEIAMRATEARIFLADDDPFDLLVHPDGSWMVMTLDVELAGVPNLDIRVNESRQASADHNNRVVVHEFMDYLTKIYEGRGVVS